MRRQTVITIQLIAWSAMTFHVTPASAVDPPTVVQNFRMGMGESKFDANQTEKYTVNVTSGNLYVKQQDFTIPSSRGPSIEVSRTYNSDNFDYPRLFGKGNWSFSLNKFLDHQAFVRCTEVGNMEDIEVGDLLEEEPDFNEEPCCDDSKPSCCDDTYPSCCDDSFPDCCDSETVLDDLCTCCDELEDCYNNTCDSICSEQSDWGGCLDWCSVEICDDSGDYDDCLSESFCDGDGSRPTDLCDDGCDCVVDPPGYIDIDCTDCTSWVYPCDDDQERDECGYYCELCDDEDECNLCVGCDDSDCCCIDGDSGDSLCNEYLCGFDVGQYEDVDGYILHNGDGDSIMIASDTMSADENPYHLEVVDEGSEPYKVKFKDGTVYTFSRGPNGNILFIDDRYGDKNRMTFSYNEGGGLQLVTDAVGRQVKIVYNQDDFIGEIVAMPDTDEEKTMHFSYTYGYLTQVVDFDGKATAYEYYPPSGSNAGLLKKITDPSGYWIRFEYDEENGKCTRVYKGKTGFEDVIGDTRYTYDELHNYTIIVDSRGNETRKYYDESENDNYYALKRITKIRDPYQEDTDYEYDEMFHLIRTIDTNKLVHKMTYDAKGNMLAKTADPAEGGNENSLDYTMSWSYEPYFNQVTSFTDANGYTKHYYYVGDGQGGGSGHGPNGVLWKEVDAEGNTFEHWYNSYGQRIKTHDGNDKVTEYQYNDDWNNLTKIIKYSPSIYASGGKFEATYTYDIWGNKTAETDFNGKPTEYVYDSMNRLTKKTVHDSGQAGEPFVTSYTYYDNGDKHTMTDPRGNTTTYGYDAGDRLSDIWEPVNEHTQQLRHTHYDYDTEGNKIFETDPNGNVTTFWYDALNRLGIKYEPLNKTTIYEYDGKGDSSTDGGSPEYTRKKDRYTEMEQYRESGDDDFVEIFTSYEYDKLYRLKKVTDDHGNETEYDYDPVGNKVWEEDANNHGTHFEYYKNNLLWKIIDPYGKYIEYTYDGMGNKASEDDKNRHKTEYYYDDRNLLTMVVYPKHDTDDPESYIYVEYVYDGMNKREERDKNGNVTKFEYNARNLLTKTTWPTNDYTTYQYDENGNKTLETDPNGNSVHYEYDALNRLHAKTDAYDSELDGLTTTYYYDNVGNRVKITDGENRSTYYDYDALNRLWQVRDARGGHTQYGYDRLGNKIWVKDAEGYTKGYRTDYYYDTLNRLKRVVNPLGKETKYDYDKVGNRTDQLDAKGQEIHYVYDDLNRLTCRTFILGDSSSYYSPNVYIGYGYDPVGNRTSMTDSRAGMDDVEYNYDEVNLLEEVIYSESGKTIHYEYDGNGNRKLMRDAENGETEYQYDSMNRLEHLYDPDGNTTDYGYDDGGRLTDMTYPNGTWTHYTYDEANRITGIVTKNSSGQTIQAISYLDAEDKPAYDKVGNKKRMVDSSGATTYDYDELYRLKYVTYPDNSMEEYGYDDVGNRKIKKVNSVITEQYGYNACNQLTLRQTAGTGAPTKEVTVTGAVSDPSYPPYSGVESVTVNGMEAEIDGGSFTAEGVELQQGENTISAVAEDMAGNTTIHDITVTYDPDITASYSCDYDYNGNLKTATKKVDGQPDEVTQYEYDYENRLTKVILPNNATNEFVYDGDKRRVSSKNKEGTITRFLYDGVNNLGDYDEEWEQTASYTQGVGIDKLIRRKDANGVRYYHADALGSTRLMTKPDQTTAAAYAYDAWGKITAQSGEGSNRHKFTGREWDAEISLQYNRARFYDPEIGRFITQDPLTKGPDDPTICYKNSIYAIADRVAQEYINAFEPHRVLNRYVYCSNNPINFTDPLGLFEIEKAVKGFFTMLGGALEMATGFGVAMVDSPAPGPADVVGALIVSVGFTDARSGLTQWLAGLDFISDDKELPDTLHTITGAITKDSSPEAKHMGDRIADIGNLIGDLLMPGVPGLEGLDEALGVKDSLDACKESYSDIKDALKGQSESNDRVEAVLEDTSSKIDWEKVADYADRLTNAKTEVSAQHAAEMMERELEKGRHRLELSDREETKDRGAGAMLESVEVSDRRKD